MTDIRLKRIYEAPSAADGYRVLVDRVWPRGITKEKAAIDLWAKDVAPSTDLRKWFDHDPAKWEEFQKRYHRELQNKLPDLTALVDKAGDAPLTLLYGAKDEEHNQAVVLHEFLQTI
ncbi:DUF488 domain-containing protein [Ochrobactrum soli]|uniref:DUF488 domain-containing protein n=1 Tax=Ochrobactrum soli TaxID=2448455 RepID=A0A849KRF7_9HYPH|nr:DUF488 domain-containing protein [[Ochrobactrum] soli]NNU59456.1 DUF488 domain-containing protein [[Ochrobactrum] soli]